MAIVFDTQEELEAFCEMFELKSMEETRHSRKFRRKSNVLAQATGTIEPVAEELETMQPLQLVAVNEAESTEDNMETLGQSSLILASAS